MYIVELVVLYVFSVVDQVSWCVYLFGEFVQVVGVGIVGVVYYQDYVVLVGQFFYGILVVLGGIVDVVFVWFLDLWEFGVQGIDDF